MTKPIRAMFDGSVLRPFCPINLEIGKIYTINVIDEQKDSGIAQLDPAYDISFLAVSTNIHDLATEHDHYLYGLPKKVYE